MLSRESTIELSEITDLNQLKSELNALPAVDVGDYISELPGERRAIAFRLLSKGKAINVFEYLPTEIQEQLIEALHDTQVCQIIEAMRPDDRVALFDELPAGVVKRLLPQLSPEKRAATAIIIGYPDGTAGRVMTTEYVRLRQGLTVGEALAKMKRSDRDKETVYYAYVTDDSRKLQQVVSLRQLVFTLPDTLITDIASDRVIKVYTETPQEDVARQMQRYDLIAVPVVDREDRLVGIITIDDVVDILEDAATEDIQKLAGVAGEDSSLSPSWMKLKNRLPWLLGIMALSIGTSQAITPFQAIIAKIPVLAVIMPLFSNVGGSVSTQTLTVTIRSLGIGEVTTKDTLKILGKEVIAGLGTAVGLGLAMTVIALIWTLPSERWVALVAGTVMATNTVIAVTMGTLVPMGFDRLNLDPALISAPLVTTLLDMIGFFLFLSLITIGSNVLQL